MARTYQSWLLLATLSTVVLLSCVCAEECDHRQLYNCPQCFDINRCDSVDSECSDCGVCRVDYYSDSEPGADGMEPCKRLTDSDRTTSEPHRTMDWPDESSENAKAINKKTFASGIAIMAMGVLVLAYMMIRNRYKRRKASFSLFDDDGTGFPIDEEAGTRSRFDSRRTIVRFHEDDARYLFGDDSDNEETVRMMHT
eukprot:m.141735 g.141735  ORF g.141735 m.141735 type:complete len:197 (+) comp16135_c0_seq10:251-841(+)